MTMTRWVRLLPLFALTTVSLTATSSEPAGPIQTIRAVGAEGKGNVAASAAWKQLAAGKVNSLLPILRAMDGANDYAANWLRAAVDAIASREIAAGQALPLSDLEKFLQEPGRNPRARRLAFELVARANPAKAEQMLAGMLNDTSMEIRLEAVQRLMNQAGQKLASGDKTAAASIYTQALGAARDVDQIENIAKQLKELGQPPDLQKHFGFITEWKVIGPFDNAENKGFGNAYPPELKLDLSGEYDGKTGKVRWQDYATTNRYGIVDLNQTCGKLKEVVAYAVADFYSDRAQSVEVRFGGDNSWKVWLNGRLLFARDEYHTGAEIDQYPMPGQLQPGRNTILVKVCQNELVKEWTETWEFQLRVTDAVGTPIVSASNARKTSNATN